MYIMTIRIKKNMVVRKCIDYSIGQGVIYFKDEYGRDNIYNIEDVDFLSIAKENL